MPIITCASTVLIVPTPPCTTSKTVGARKSFEIDCAFRRHVREQIRHFWVLQLLLTVVVCLAWEETTAWKARDGSVDLLKHGTHLNLRAPRFVADLVGVDQ